MDPKRSTLSVTLAISLEGSHNPITLQFRCKGNSHKCSFCLPALEFVLKILRNNLNYFAKWESYQVVDIL